MSKGQMVFTAGYLLAWPALMLWLSGDWLWPEGWIWGVWFVATTAGCTIYLYYHDPDLLQERFRKPGTGNAEPWDKVFFALTGTSFLAWIVVMPLDSVRMHWSPEFPFAIKAIGSLLLLLSSYLLYAAFRDNTFLSPLIRIQEERKQKLITTGIYSVVRHPMYAGALCLFVGSPLLLSSWAGLGVGAVVVGLMAWRTLGEERMLLREFPDYQAYQQKTRYRWVPYIW